MKICISFMSFSRDIFAGIENSIYNLSMGFKALGLDVLVYSSYLSGDTQHEDTIPVFRSKILPRSLPEGDLTIQKTLTENSSRIKYEFCGLLRDEQIDYAITCDALWGITQVSGAWECAPCPIILSLHVLNTPELLKQAKKIPYLFRRTVSPILKRQIEEVLPLENLVVIPNSIDTTQFRPFDNAGRDSKIIFCNARINPDKGIIYLIRAFSQFMKAHPEFELWLCNGDFPFGDKKIALYDLKLELGLQGVGRRVRLLPNLSWLEVPGIIRQAFVVVLPTLYESFGRAAIEALACGVPLIASRTGNLPDLVDDSAILVEPRSPQSIHEALELLYHHHEVYDRLATQGPLVAAKYDNKKVASQFLRTIHYGSGPNSL